MLGGLALKWRWKTRRIAAGKPYDKPNFVCGPVQICWDKFARYFDVEIRQVPLRGGALGLEPDDLRQYCNENTIGVIATLGVTFTGIYEPVAALAQLGLARANALNGEKEKARSAYQGFLALWKNADPNIPILRQAKAENANLQQ